MFCLLNIRAEVNMQLSLPDVELVMMFLLLFRYLFFATC